MTTLNLQVSADTDNAEKYWGDAAWTFRTTYIGAGWNSVAIGKRGCGSRFLNVTIPPGSTIDTATIIITSRSSGYTGTVCNTRVRGEDTDDPITFSDITDFDARARTDGTGVPGDGYVNWDGLVGWVLDTEYTSPEIKAIIQEIIDRGGWASGNDIVIFWDDFDDRSDHNSGCMRSAYSHYNDSAKAPKLHIEYTPPVVAVGRSYGYIIG